MRAEMLAREPLHLGGIDVPDHGEDGSPGRIAALAIRREMRRSQPGDRFLGTEGIESVGMLAVERLGEELEGDARRVVLPRSQLVELELAFALHLGRRERGLGDALGEELESAFQVAREHFGADPERVPPGVAADGTAHRLELARQLYRAARSRSLRGEAGEQHVDPAVGVALRAKPARPYRAQRNERDGPLFLDEERASTGQRLAEERPRARLGESDRLALLGRTRRRRSPRSLARRLFRLEEQRGQPLRINPVSLGEDGAGDRRSGIDASLAGLAHDPRGQGSDTREILGLELDARGARLVEPELARLASLSISRHARESSSSVTSATRVA